MAVLTNRRIFIPSDQPRLQVPSSMCNYSLFTDRYTGAYSLGYLVDLMLQVNYIFDFEFGIVCKRWLGLLLFRVEVWCSTKR